MKTKIVVGAVLLLFWGGVTAILASEFVSNEANKKIRQIIEGDSSPQITAGIVQGQEPTVVAVGNNQNSNSIVLTASEIAKHNSRADCWMIIGGKVYNLTGFIAGHPGGASVMASYCGRDGTVGFQTQGGKGSHSSTANAMLASYFLGNLNQQANSEAFTTTVSPIQGNTLNPTIGSTGDEDEVEDEDEDEDEDD